jgi:DNA-binding SARP family transcriptional activator
LVYGLHRTLKGELDGAAPILYLRGYYHLNTVAGVVVDVTRFDELANSGDEASRAGRRNFAADLSRRAVDLYRGDLSTSADTHAVIERERLRARFLGLLARVADHAFERSDYPMCLGYALRMLEHDPFREDAYRLVMRCHVRLGERSQALRQYRLCEQLLAQEFDAPPEPATTALYHQLRLTPDSV